VTGSLPCLPPPQLLGFCIQLRPVIADAPNQLSRLFARQAVFLGKVSDLVPFTARNLASIWFAAIGLVVSHHILRSLVPACHRCIVQMTNSQTLLLSGRRQIRWCARDRLMRGALGALECHHIPIVVAVLVNQPSPGAIVLEAPFVGACGRLVELALTVDLVTDSGSSSVDALRAASDASGEGSSGNDDEGGSHDDILLRPPLRLKHRIQALVPLGVGHWQEALVHDPSRRRFKLGSQGDLIGSEPVSLSKVLGLGFFVQHQPRIVVAVGGAGSHGIDLLHPSPTSKPPVRNLVPFGAGQGHAATLDARPDERDCEASDLRPLGTQHLGNRTSRPPARAARPRPVLTGPRHPFTTALRSAIGDPSAVDRASKALADLPARTMRRLLSTYAALNLTPLRRR
jgi:hypothetical protein